MKKLLSASLAALIIAGASSIYAESPSFSDVKSGDWFYAAVTDAAERGILTGVGDGVFSPNGKMTRAQMVTVLARLSGEDATGKSVKMKFVDTDENAWYADYIGWGVEKGIAGGYPDGTFMPDEPVLRQELASFFVRYLNYANVKLPDAPKIEVFRDKDQIPEWAAEDVETLRLTGLMSGDGGRFNPNGETTRAEFATVVSRYFEVLPESRDIMYSALENIMDTVETKARRIYLKTGVTDWMTAENIGSLLLPQMGLDVLKYELIIPDQELEELRSDNNYGSITPDNSLSYTLDIAVKNRESGEITETKRCNFLFEKTNILVYVDPDDFDSGIDEVKYEEMKKRSIVSVGDLSRFAKAIKKAESGEDITVAYIGGSVTEGTGGGASSCYARISANWIAKRYPDINVNYVNAGIGGTTSVLGNIRVGEDVLSRNPDIVFVEFGVNDRDDDHHLETYESLVRTILSSEGDPAAILLFSAHKNIDAYPGNGYGRQETQKLVGEFYDLPMISIGSAINPAIEEGLIEWSDFSGDDVHPNKWGHQVYSDMIEYFLDTARASVKNMSDDELKISPIETDSHTPARYENLKFRDRSSLDLVSAGSWKDSQFGDRFDNGWKRSGAENENSPFTFKFTGSNLFLLYQGGEDFARLRVSIDGGDEIEVYSGGGSGIGYKLIASLEAEGEHTVSIRVRDEDKDRDAYIFAAAYN